MNDPGSLQNLNDIVMPAPVGLWPPAPGWYVVIAVVLALAVLAGFRALKARRQNAYRREALAELDRIREWGEASAHLVPELLKRTALSAWPRDEVADLNSSAWHAFLDQTGSTEDFGSGAGRALDELSYAGRGAPRPSTAEYEQLCRAAEAWIRQHRREEAGP